jgi:crotonobetainyl-CoA:carnitine CoA-transferase CaiB-like acyl-CoA transferase
MHNAKPLKGIRALDFGAYVAGPYAGAILASLGAEVVKIEPTRGGDPFRRGEGTTDPYFIQMNAGKKSLAVDLKTPDGLALVKALIPHFDVLLENTRPGKMAALGLGAEDIKRLNPSMIYTSVSGFGEGGPWRDRAAYDTICLSMSGFLSIMSNEDDVQLAGTCVGDLTSGLIVVIGILAGLVGRGLSSEHTGADVQTSLLEAMSTITIDAMTHVFNTGHCPSRETRHPVAQSFCLKTADGAAIAVHLSGSEKFWVALTKAMDRTDLAEDPRFVSYHERKRHYFELRPIIENEFVKYDRPEWERRLVEADVPYAPVVTAAELPNHPQMKWLDMYEPERDGLRLVRAPWRFSGHRPTRQFRAPDLGEHSREVALQVLPPADVDTLIASGVLVQA